MEKRPRIKLELNFHDKIVDWIGWGLLAVIWFFAIYGYVYLPETIPVHFDIAGKPDGYGNKISILFIPFLTTALLAGMTILNNYPHIFNYPVKITELNVVRQYRSATRLIRWLKLFIALIFTIILLSIYNAAINMQTETMQWIIPLILLLTFVPVVVYLVSASKNSKKLVSGNKTRR
ncbi:MAG: DUF1648 domain-containing protein [Bacteroidales bacterium]|nr:DUF1648 domain-containing protein [Bacteroidales bacterium]